MIPCIPKPDRDAQTLYTGTRKLWLRVWPATPNTNTESGWQYMRLSRNALHHEGSSRSSASIIFILSSERRAAHAAECSERHRGAAEGLR